MLFTQAKLSDLPFMQKMLYEAVFWRGSNETPTFEDAMVLPYVANVLEDWGERTGDTAIIAASDGKLIGAAWYRYWTEENNTRGYYDETVPVLVLAVDDTYRRQGIGARLIAHLIERAKKDGIKQISLCVSKDNHAYHLYTKTGFREHIDIGDSLIMVRDL